MIRDEIRALVQTALQSAQASGALPTFTAPEVQLEHPARPEHGDYSANLPLRIQGLARMKAIEIAEALRPHVPAHPAVIQVRIAPHGLPLAHSARTIELIGSEVAPRFAAA